MWTWPQRHRPVPARGQGGRGDLVGQRLQDRSAHATFKICFGRLLPVAHKHAQTHKHTHTRTHARLTHTHTSHHLIAGQASHRKRENRCWIDGAEGVGVEGGAGGWFACGAEAERYGSGGFKAHSHSRAQLEWRTGGAESGLGVRRRTCSIVCANKTAKIHHVLHRNAFCQNSR